MSSFLAPKRSASPTDPLAAVFLVLWPLFAAVAVICVLSADQNEWIGWWRDHRLTWMLLAFLSRHLPQVWIEHVFCAMSPAFATLNPILRRNDSNLLVTFTHFFFWAPVNLWVVYHLFVLGPREFANRFAEFGETMVILAMVGEWHDLSQRHSFNGMLHLHHMGESVIAIVVLEWWGNPDHSQLDPGLFILTLLSTLDRLVYAIFPMDHIVKQHRDSPCQLDRSFDKFITKSLVIRLYRASFFYYTVFVRGFVAVLVGVYVLLNRERIGTTWTALLPLGVLFFFLVDLDMYRALWKRGFTERYWQGSRVSSFASL